MTKSTFKLKIPNLNLYECIAVFFIMAIPLQPLVTRYGYYLSGGLCMLFLVWCIKRFRFLNFEIYYGIFLVYSLLSVNRSPNGSFAMVKVMLISFCFAVCGVKLLYGVIKDADKTVEFIGYWIAKGSVLITLYCIWYERPFHAGANRLGTKVFADYGTRMFLTYSLTLSLLFLLQKVMSGRARTWNYIELFVVFTGIALSGTRKLLIIFGLFVVLYYWIEHRKNILKLIKFLVIGFFGIVFLFYLFTNISFLYNNFGVRFQMLFDFLETGRGDSSASVRMQMTADAFHTFLSHKLLGVGTDGFRALFMYEGVRLYSHNNFAELLCNLGITGFLLFYVPYFTSIGRFIKNRKRKTRYGNFFLAALISIMVSEYFTITYYQVPFLLFYELASLYAAQGTILEERKNYPNQSVKALEESCYE